MGRPRVQVLLERAPVPSEVHDALRNFETEVVLSPLGADTSSSGTPMFDARLVVTSHPSALANGVRGKLLDWFDRTPCPTLVLSPTANAPADEDTAESDDRAIWFANDLTEDELAGRISAMCSFGKTMTSMRRRLESLSRQEQVIRADWNRLREERRHAARVQRDLLPAELPSIAGSELHVLYRPIDVVGGDIYDVVRLDESRIAFSLLDATGHGMPAALLAAFFRRALRAAETASDGKRQLEPDEILSRLNREILEAGLSDCEFAAVLYAVYDERTRVMRWARGGASYPILVRKGSPPRQITSEGPLLGVRDEPEFELVEQRLETGDTLLFHTDGLEALLVNPRDGEKTHDLTGADWLLSLSSASIAGRMGAMEQRLDAVADSDWDADDTTIIALRVTERMPERNGQPPPDRLEAALCDVHA